MLWVYFSPHLDDAVLSCGGLIHNQIRAGNVVEIWTVCAGDPPAGDLSPFAQSLHQRWQAGSNVVGTRRREDRAACQVLGVKPLHLPVPDSIYRRHPVTKDLLYTSEQTIFGVLDPVEYPFIEVLAERIQQGFPEVGEFNIVSPMGIGGHVDHDLTRRLAEALHRPLHYYADFPYSLGIPIITLDDLQPIQAELAPEDIRAWQNAIRAYQSQLSTFWESEREMENAVKEYYEKRSGVFVWESIPS